MQDTENYYIEERDDAIAQGMKIAGFDSEEDYLNALDEERNNAKQPWGSEVK